MKKTFIIMFLAIVTPLLLLQLSCAGVKESHPQEAAAVEEEEAPAAVEEEGGEAMLLADKHEAAGISCSDCHAEDPPATGVKQATCLTCHGDYKEVAASYLDPHNAHISYSDCGDCHHIHRTSEKICQGCHHTFNMQAP